MINLRRLYSVSVLVILAIAATLAVSPAQAAAPEPGAQYVALGSSYAAGARVGPADPDDSVGCGRTTSAYPSLVADALGLDLTNSACSGAKIENIAVTPQRASVPVQIDAVTADTELVTITIGGNDLNYVGNLQAEACLGDLANNPASPISLARQQAGSCAVMSDADVRTALAGLETEMIAMVRSIQVTAPDARIILVDYQTVLAPNAKPCDVAPIPRDRQKVLLEVARNLSLTTKHVAQRTGSDFVAASKVSRGHDVCSSDPWMTGYDFTPGRTAMHPNEAGHAAVADAVLAELRAGHRP